jgi:hypothetical protein
LSFCCFNPTSGGTIEAAQSGSSPFDPAAFTSSAAATGHSGTLEYKWQSSTTSSSASFYNIEPSNAATYNAGALTRTTWYKRLARVSCRSNWTGAVQSNVLEVTVCGNPTSGGTIAAAQSGNSPFDPVAFTSSAAIGHSGTLEYKWQSSTTSSSAGFSDIASSNAATYNAGALTQTTWYKRLARVSCQSNWTGAAESNVLKVTVCGNPTSGGTIAAAQSGNSPFDPVAFTSSAAASGHSGTLEYKWQSSTTSNTTGFSDIASSNSDVYDPGSLTQTTWYKRLARVSCQSNWTGAAESNVLEVTVASMAAEPTAQPTALYFTTTGTSPTFNLVGRFTAAASSAGYLVVRNTGSAPTFTPADGTAYSAGSQTGGTVVYSGSAADFTESSVTLDLAYHYAVYAFNGSGSTTNYLTTSPLTGMAFARSAASGTLSSSGASSSLGFPAAGATVNFPAGTTGTTLNVTKNNSAPSSNIQVSSSIRGMKPLYFSITSSTASPGAYTLILDFSALSLTATQWNSYKVMKRANASSPWVDVTTLGATIVNRQTDGAWGKFTITGLSSFSDFGLAEVYDGVVVSNLDQTVEGTFGVTDDNYNGQAFVTDGLRYQLSKVKVSASNTNINDLRARLYGSTAGGEVNTSVILANLGTPTLVSGSVYELTPSSATVKLEPNTQYWIVFYSNAANQIDINYTSSKLESGPASFPTNLSVSSVITTSGGTYNPADGADPYMFSVEATEVSRTWTGAASTTSWTTAGNWTPSEIPGNGEILTIPSVANDPVLPANTSVAYLTVASGAVVNLADKTLTVTHGLSQDGTVTGTTGKLIMAGTAAQGIEGTGTIRNLEVNNAAGVAVFAGSHRQSITGVLTPTAGTLTTNGNLTLKSSASGTARVAAGSSSGGYVSGNVTVERYIPAGRKWRFLTAPLTGSSYNSIFYNWQNNDVVNGSTGVEIWGPAPNGTSDPSSTNNGLAVGANYSMRSYGSSGWANVTSTNSTLLFDNTTNYGFALFQTGPYNNGSTAYIGSGSSLPAGAATTLSATGSLITGDHTKSFTATSAGQYFLVANPYASPVNPASFTTSGTVNRTNLDNVLYMWDAKPGNGVNRGLGRYVAYDITAGSYSNGGTGTGFANNLVQIQSGQAFFVRSTAAGAATLVFRESNKSATDAHDMFGSSTQAARKAVHILLHQDSTHIDGAKAFFHADGKSSLDALDGYKLMNSTDNLGLRREGKTLVFEHRPEIKANDTLVTSLTQMQAGAFRLRLALEGFTADDGVKAELVDRQLNRRTPLSLTDTTDFGFTVTADSASSGDRFIVVFTKSASTGSGTTEPGEVIRMNPYPNPVVPGLPVRVDLEAGRAPWDVQLIDATGRLVWKRTVKDATEMQVRIDMSRMGSGVYQLLMTDAKGERIVSRVVKNQ